MFPHTDGNRGGVVLLALCISSFWFTLAAIQKECESCLFYFMLYPTVFLRCLLSLPYNLVEGGCMKSLLGCLCVVICPNIQVAFLL